MDSVVRLGEAVLPDGVTIERHVAGGLERVRLTAARELTGIATGRFSRLGARVALEFDGQPDFLGFAYTQFALPVIAGPSLDFDFDPAPNLHCPPVLGMLLARVHDEHVLLAPLDHPHEHVIGVADGRLQWGWQRDLDDMRAGFSATLGIYTGTSAAELLDRWRSELGAGLVPASSDANAIPSPLSYWSDNGEA